MRRRTCLLSILTALALTGPAAVVGAPAVQAESSVESSAASYLVARINAVRARHGLGPLKVKADLVRHAQAHSSSMSRQHGLFHTANFRVICCWSSISENVASNRTATGAHRSLMNSAPHRANILDPSKRGVGVGVVRADGKLWVTQVFRQPWG